MKYLMLKLLPIFLLSAAYQFLFTDSAFALEYNNLVISPTSQELTVDPGEKSTLTFKLLNQSDIPISGNLKMVDFIINRSDNIPTLLENPLYNTTPWFAASDWFVIPHNQLEIATNDRILFQIKINVPENAKPGGHYVALIFSPIGEETTAANRITSLIFLRVTGSIIENASITNFIIPSFSEYGPINIITEITNQGDYHINPHGIITLYNQFEKIYDRVDLDEHNIFPANYYRYQNTFNHKWMLGRFKAELSAVYGETNKPLYTVFYFWVIPWKELTAIILSIIISIILLITIFRRFIYQERQLEKIINDLKKKLNARQKNNN